VDIAVLILIAWQINYCIIEILHYCQVKSEVGVVTVLFNNAGLSMYSSFLESNPVMEEKVIQVNLMSCFWTIREFLPGMIERGEGHLVQTCSALGFWRHQYLAAYVASKYGMRGLIKSLRLEMQRHPKKPNIKFSTIYPGWTRTPMLDPVSWTPRLVKITNNNKSWHLSYCPRPWMSKKIWFAMAF